MLIGNVVILVLVVIVVAVVSTAVIMSKTCNKMLKDVMQEGYSKGQKEVASYLITFFGTVKEASEAGKSPNDKGRKEFLEAVLALQQLTDRSPFGSGRIFDSSALEKALEEYTEIGRKAEDARRQESIAYTVAKIKKGNGTPQDLIDLKGLGSEPTEEMVNMVKFTETNRRYQELKRRVQNGDGGISEFVSLITEDNALSESDRLSGSYLVKEAIEQKRGEIKNQEEHLTGLLEKLH